LDIKEKCFTFVLDLNKMKITQKDYIKAIKKGDREAELSFSNGWVSKNEIFKSEKNYSRKNKHKKKITDF